MKRPVLLVSFAVCIITGNASSATSNRLSYDEAALKIREYNINKYAPKVQLLIEEIESPNENIRIQAARLLGKSCDSNAVDTLAKHLKNDQSAEVRYECAKSLGIIRSRAAIAPLVNALKDPVANIALESAISLSLLGDKEHCLPILIDRLNDSSRDIRMKALKGMSSLGNIHALSFALDDKVPYVRVEAAIFLTKLGKNALALPVLEKNLTSQEKYVRLAALRGLKNIESDKAISLIRKAMSDPDREVQRRATVILQDLEIEVGVVLAIRAARSASYDAEAAVAYAEEWWDGRNPAYYDYSYEGGDCANFVSQCLIAGGVSLDDGPGVDSWGCIPFCDHLHSNLVNSQNAQHEIWARGEVEPLWFLPGDPAMFGDYGDYWRHAVFAVTGDDYNYATCNAHSEDNHHISIETFFDNNPTWSLCNYYKIEGLPVQPPTVETTSATNISETAATINGLIIDDGGEAIDERRFDWGTTSSCSDGWTSDVTVNGDSFSYQLTGLQPDTTYYFRAWAHNSAGWGNGDVLSFITNIPVDTTPPTVDAFSVTPESVTLGNSFTISYTVSDSGGSGLNRAELWRANDSGGSPVGWEQIQITDLSGEGDGPYTDSFLDAPSSTGNYWYGLHVVDNAENMGLEPDPPGPIIVTVIPPNHDPQLSNGLVNPGSGDTNTDFYWYVDYFDEDNDPPLTKDVYIDDTAYTMSLHSGSASNGTYRYGPTNLGVGTHNYYFYFTDGNGGSDRLPGSGTYSGPSVSSTGDSYEPDNIYSQANWIYDGSPQNHSIVPADDLDWVKFSLSEESEVVIETSGSSGDTRMWLYDSSLIQIDYDDDDGPGLFSRIDRECGVDALPAGTYYVKIDELGNNNEIQSYDITLTVSECGGDEGWKSPIATGYVGDNGWNNPTYAYDADNQYATMEGSWYWQYWTGFNFNIPTNTIIDGIEVEFDIYSDSSLIKRFWAYVYKGTDFSGKTDSNNNPNLIWLAGSEETYTKGGADDLWNQTWTATDFSGNNFKIVVSSDVPNIYLDHIRAKVYYTEVILEGDVNGDGKIDFTDYAILSSQWLQPPGFPSADIFPPEGDGIVDLLDLSLVIQHWLEGTNP